MTEFENKVFEFNKKYKFSHDYNLIGTILCIMEKNYGVKQLKYPDKYHQTLSEEIWNRWFIFLNRHNYIYNNMCNYLHYFIDNNNCFPDIEHVIKQVGKYYLLYESSNY